MKNNWKKEYDQLSRTKAETDPRYYKDKFGWHRKDLFIEYLKEQLGDSTKQK